MIELQNTLFLSMLVNSIVYLTNFELVILNLIMIFYITWVIELALANIYSLLTSNIIIYYIMLFNSSK
jgi:hypothetical protein